MARRPEGLAGRRTICRTPTPRLPGPRRRIRQGDDSMLAVAARPWWVLVLQGILGVIVGVLALLLPGVTALTIAYLFAAWAIISGVSSVSEGVRVAEHRGRSWPFAVIGVFSIV